MLSSRKWNDGKHWSRFTALLACSLLIVCFTVHSAKGESTMLLKPAIEQSGTSIEGVLYTPNGEGPFPTVILTHGFTGTGIQLFRLLIRNAPLQCTITRN